MIPEEIPIRTLLSVFDGRLDEYNGCCIMFLLPGRAVFGRIPVAPWKCVIA